MPYPNRKKRYPFKRQLRRRLKRIGFMVILAALVAAMNYYKQSGTSDFQQPDTVEHTRNSSQTLLKLKQAAADTTSSFWITLNAEVIKLLKDDLRGSRHQKFLVDADPSTSRLSLLISHNIDLAARIPLKVGDHIQLRGMYEWNNRGGVIHWTHHDPDGRHSGGWIKAHGKVYR